MVTPEVIKRTNRLQPTEEHPGVNLDFNSLALASDMHKFSVKRHIRGVGLVGVEVFLKRVSLKKSHGSGVPAD